MEPIYLSVKQAAKEFGIGCNTLRDILNSRDHPPYLQIGNAKKIRKEALQEYFEKREIK